MDFQRFGIEQQSHERAPFGEPSPHYNGIDDHKGTRVRIGVDVGGTFTKAVAVRIEPVRVIAQAVTPTTHHDPVGVARGVITVLQQLLKEIQGAVISVVAHSTTQAVNALLEGDVTSVGIIGFGPAHQGRTLRKRVTPGLITLAPGRTLATFTEWLDEPLSESAIQSALERLKSKGAGAIVASGFFAVENPADELRIIEAAARIGLPAVGGHQVSGNYGLEIRTTTAAINASILPKMTETAAQVERCLRDAGITVPLLLMRGDGGLMEAEALRSRPILSLLSGPAASVTGALFHAHTLDGIFIEVGGTSTNIAAIRDGEPALEYVRVMDHPTCVRSLDVRVQGVAGGSLIRVQKRKTVDVGPRSAHIAGLPYLCYSQPAGRLQPELIAPTAGDPKDYVVVVDEVGTCYALTLTCADQALKGDANALTGFAALGTLLGCSGSEAAAQAQTLAAKRIAVAVDDLAHHYHIKTHQLELIGGGGGAEALVPAVAAALETPYRIAEQAAVISSIGVALALVREEVERGIDFMTPDQIATEARDQAIRAGADPATVEISTEAIPERGTVRAVAVGALRLEGTPDQQRPELSLEALLEIVALRVEVRITQVSLAAEIGRYAICAVRAAGLVRGRWAGAVVITRYGAIKLVGQRAEILIVQAKDDLAHAETWITAKTPHKITIISADRLLTFTESESRPVIEALRAGVRPFGIIRERLSWV